MTIETFTGSTAPASLVTAPLGGASGEPDGVPVLGVAYDLARCGCLPAQRPAQLAHQAPAAPVKQVDALADQRRAPAVDATISVSLERAEAVMQKQAFELLDVGDG